MRKWVVAALVAVAALLGAGVAYAAIPGPDGVIHGCYSTGLGSGALYVIDSEGECPSGYEALNWNQTAPIGLAGYAVVTNIVTVTGAQQQQATAEVDCAVGTFATGGGGYGGLVLSSRPTLDGNGLADGWSVTVREQDLTSSAPITATVWAVCAEVTP